MRYGALTATLAIAIASTAAAATGATTGGHGRLGRNLVRNGDGATGAYSVQGWDSVTIPGWQVGRGLPTVVRYRTRRFPLAHGHHRLTRLFAGGPGGPATLVQTVSLRSPRGELPPSGTRYRMSAWLGGTRTSEASLVAVFLSPSGRIVGAPTIGPVGRAAKARLAKRSASGILPNDAAKAVIVLRLTTSLKNYDGPRAPIVGYNRAVGGDLRFSVSSTVRRPAPVVPPVAHVPHFDHVFLFMFENQDFRTVIGNRKQLPYLNSLVPHGTVLANLFAEEHPSDGNYLAIAGGSTFGIPLTDPLEINPEYSIDARNIGDLVDAAHETWRAYLQTAAGPCDDTVHGYYWNDDLPFLYFPDIRNRPAYCARHVVPLEALNGDLASAKTTPNFSWIAADDCSDMEGCGLRKGDQFLAQTLGTILRSPAWRTQRSLAIITFDEDAYNHEHPPQLIPTVVLGSRDVRQGYVSHVRYTHYSLLRTIEAALHLRTLTPNDRYAQPLNDVFTHARDSSTPTAPADPTAPRPAVPAYVAPTGGGSGEAGSGRPRALVAGYRSNTVTPISPATAKAGKAIPVGSGPDAIALTPAGRTAYVANSGSGTVTPIDTANMRPGRPIRVGSDPSAIAVAPDGRTAYVVDAGSNAVTPIDTATNRAQPPIRVGTSPRSIALVPHGRDAYVLDWGGSSITPIDLKTRKARPPIPVGSYPVAIAFAPHKSMAYVANNGSSTVTPVDTATNRASKPIAVAQAPNALAVTSNGSKLIVVSGDKSSVIPISTANRRVGHGIRVGYSPEAIALAAHNATAWVVSTIAGTVTPFSTHTGRLGKPISVGVYSYPTSITFTPGGTTAVVLGTYAGKVSLVNTSKRTVRAIKIGGYPDAVAITR